MIAFAIAVAVGIAALYSVWAIRYCVHMLRWLPRQERWERTAQGLCPTCGYDLTGNVSGVCPECGTKLGGRVEDPHEAPSLYLENQPWWVWAVVVTTMILAVIVKRLLER